MKNYRFKTNVVAMVTIQHEAVETMEKS
jgi:hypothetical protein